MKAPTPRPWHNYHMGILGCIGADGNELAQVLVKNSDYSQAEANSNHLVKCVNLHDELIAALVQAQATLIETFKATPTIRHAVQTEIVSTQEVLRKVLAKAEGDK